MTAITAVGHGIGGTTVKVVGTPFRFSGRNVNPVVTVVTPFDVVTLSTGTLAL